MNKYILKFTMSLGASEKLLIGTLQLLKDGRIINEYQATSSFPGRQYEGSWGRKGGLIPPQIDYQVSLQPIDLSGTSGIDGDFYAITPFEQDVAGVTRGDFGIHPDWWKYGKGGVGTLGCIGIQTKRGWSAFQRDMQSIATGIDDMFIPLVVSYH
jgi:hypothetical protein